jgi:hypothetical protein
MCERVDMAADTRVVGALVHFRADGQVPVVRMQIEWTIVRTDAASCFGVGLWLGPK